MAGQVEYSDYPREEAIIISETIPDDLPDWAIKAMAEGKLFKEVFARIDKLTEIITKYEMKQGLWE